MAAITAQKRCDDDDDGDDYDNFIEVSMYLATKRANWGHYNINPTKLNK